MVKSRQTAKEDALFYAVEMFNHHKDEYAHGVRKLYPVGSKVRYIKHGHAIQNAIVEIHGYDDDLFVRNISTDKLIKIQPYHILEARSKRVSGN